MKKRESGVLGKFKVDGKLKKERFESLMNQRESERRKMKNEKHVGTAKNLKNEGRELRLNSRERRGGGTKLVIQKI